MMELEKICQQVCSLVKEVGVFIQTEQSKINSGNIEVKGLNDFVTYVDKTSEKMLVEVLLKILPEAGFITEEKTISKKGEHYNWIIDPVDGTTNFIHSLPIYCISIGLMRDEKIILGVIYEINFEECFYAWENSKAYMNGKEIKVSNTSKLKDSLLATGFPYHDYGKLNEYLKLFQHYMKNTHGVRRLGSAAADMAYVACGRFEGFYEYGLQPWDVAAGVIIIQQAGGKLSDFSGGNNYIFGRELIASNANIFDEFLLSVKQFFFPLPASSNGEEKDK